MLHAACAVCFLNCKHIKMEKDDLKIIENGIVREDMSEENFRIEYE